MAPRRAKYLEQVLASEHELLNVLERADLVRVQHTECHLQQAHLLGHVVGRPANGLVLLSTPENAPQSIDDE